MGKPKFGQAACLWTNMANNWGKRKMFKVKHCGFIQPNIWVYRNYSKVSSCFLSLIHICGYERKKKNAMFHICNLKNKRKKSIILCPVW